MHLFKSKEKNMTSTKVMFQNIKHVEGKNINLLKTIFICFICNQQLNKDFALKKKKSQEGGSEDYLIAL